MTQDLIADDVRDGTPAEKLIYVTLLVRGACSKRDVVEETGLSERAVGDLLGNLEDAGLVERRRNLSDTRQWIFELDIETDPSGDE